MSPPPYLVRVVAPHFVAGFEVEYELEYREDLGGCVAMNERIVRAAPILRWTVGKPVSEVRAYLRSKGYDARVRFA